MIEFRTNKERMTMTVAELNAKLEAGVDPGTLTNIFIETTTPETFSSLYEQLAPRLRESVVKDAKMNAANFEECIAWARREGLYADGWVAFRDWARAQPWFPEALAKAEYYKSLEVPYWKELERQLAFLEGAILLQENEVIREDIERDIQALRLEIPRQKAKGDY